MVHGLLIGRFQPFHLGHLAALKFALNMVDCLFIGIGSSNKPIEAKNPFTASERKEMITLSLEQNSLSRISIYEIPDVNNHVKWLSVIDEIVPSFKMVFTNDDLTHHLYSRRTDVKTLNIPFSNREQLSGTRIRYLIKRDALQNSGEQSWRDLVPSGTLSVLNKCDVLSRFSNL